MLTDDNEFSFPVITSTKPVPNFTTPSTSLWRISSLVYPNCYSEGEDHDHDHHHHDDGGDDQRGSRSELSRRKSSSYDVDISEERMDMLWEDFNYEDTTTTNNHHHKVGDLERRLSTATSRCAREYFDGYGNGETGMARVMKEDKKEWKISTHKTRVLKRPSMVVVVRAFKKLLFLQNLARNRN